MDLDNLAKMFGPSIVGYSVPDATPETILQETVFQQNVREYICTHT